VATLYTEIPCRSNSAFVSSIAVGIELRPHSARRKSAGSPCGACVNRDPSADRPPRTTASSRAFVGCPLISPEGPAGIRRRARAPGMPLMVGPLKGPPGGATDGSDERSVRFSSVSRLSWSLVKPLGLRGKNWSKRQIKRLVAGAEGRLTIEARLGSTCCSSFFGFKVIINQDDQGERIGFHGKAA